ncbi:helix-turn-helix domain-containing protein [Streptomyces sp. NBC_00984]|uniref:helix-turn-helix domain-containing protein n=1 Tax=Streptomyces sp. NBC_00984 TaxID=2903700 RepID=UPI00386BADB0|nr:helix-turn-helix domain-containing protein [Streptomyces sp. NBC_00984]
MSFDPRPLRAAAAARGDNTVTAIAARLGAPYPTVRRWTSGRGEPKGATLAAIQRIYGVTPASLYPTPDTAA